MIPTPSVSAQCFADGHSLTCRVAVTCSDASPDHARFTARLESSHEEAPGRVTVEVRFPAELAWYLTPRRSFVSLQGEVRPPWPVGCLALLQHQGTVYQVNFEPLAHFRLALRGEALVARFVLRDKQRCGFRLWGEDKLHQAPVSHTLNIRVSRLASPDQAVWFEPFPRSARSVICLTDHPDWDSCAKLAALDDLFSPHEFRITKGVFPVADVNWPQYGPGLESPSYVAAINRWYEKGHEIAYHGIGSCGNIPHLDLPACLARIKALAPYHPETWIDHGCGEYGFARSARLPDEVSLVEVLTREGVRNFWSYTDAWENPARHLNIWDHRTLASSFVDFLALVIQRKRMTPRQFAYLGTIPLKNLGGPSQYQQVLRHPCSASQWRELARNYRQLRELNADPLYLYDHNGDFALTNPQGLWLFDTIVFNHLALQLCPANIDRLAACGGMLIGHIYLGWMPPRSGQNCFKVGTSADILPTFRDNVAYIGQMQKTGNVITLPLRDLRRSLVRYAANFAVRHEHGWELQGDGVVCSRRAYRTADQPMQRNNDGNFSVDIHGTVQLQDIIA